MEQIATRSDQILKRGESGANRTGEGARPKPQFLLANSNLWAEVAETMPTAASRAFWTLSRLHSAEPTLDATVELSVVGALFSIAPHLMIVVESSNRQQIWKRLRGSFTNKFRKLPGRRLVENA
jgi:hypothetical protein